MTVRELKDRLEQFPDGSIVLIPNCFWHPYSVEPTMIPATSVARGVNEFDGCIIIDDYTESSND